MATRGTDGQSNSMFSCLLFFVVAKPFGGITCESPRVKELKDNNPTEKDLQAQYHKLFREVNGINRSS